MPKEKTASNTIPRAALYVRVSGQEQAIKGLSLEAQQEDLEEYARAQGWIIAGVYIDAAKTARKRLYKRTNFLRMLEDVKQDKIDLILFTRLDRWFRSVADYYKVMEVLEAHHCDWKTTQEQYDTSTAGGRLYINLRLSIAQNEADLCGERISAVFDNKIKHGTVVSGAVPFGYRINDQKRLEIVPDQAAIVLDVFEHYRAVVSKRATLKYVRETYGINWCPGTMKNILQQQRYTGYYESRNRVKENFCPAIVPQELFDEVQRLLDRNAKQGPAGRIYLFSSILICNECGHRLSSAFNRKPYYRCYNYSNRRLCTHKRNIREEVLEKWLLEHIESEFAQYRMKWEQAEEQRKRTAKSVDRAAIRRKLARLQDLYVNELIDIENYRRDYEMYMDQLAVPPEQENPRPNFENIDALLSKGFRRTYEELSQEGKRTFWRSIIREIHIDNDNQVVNIIFS